MGTLKKALVGLGILFAGFMGFRIVQFGLYLRKESQIEAQKKAESDAAKAKREAEFKAMSPSEHIAQSKAQGFSPLALKHLQAVPDGTPGKAELEAEWKAHKAELEAQAKKVAAARAAEEEAARKKELAEWRKQGVEIGMTKERVLLSNWGKPEHVNRTTRANGTVHEQWVYAGRHNYLYFEDGILTSIQN